VQALQIDVANRGPASEPTHVSQVLDPALAALFAPGGTLTDHAFGFDFSLDSQAERTLLTLVRMPDRAGSWTATTTVGAVDPGGALIGQGTQVFTLTGGRTGSSLQSTAVAAAGARDLAADLAAIRPCAGASATEVESNIHTVIDVLGDARVTSASFRATLDALLRYEESCWSLTQ
jgi:hypothetical protein